MFCLDTFVVLHIDHRGEIGRKNLASAYKLWTFSQFKGHNDFLVERYVFELLKLLICEMLA